MSNIVLWLDSIIQTDDTGQASLARFLFAARQWFVEHGGRMEGFVFPATSPWWEGRATPFRADAQRGCKLWRLAIDADLSPALASTPATLTLPEGRAGMDVFEVWRPGGALPDWFVVYRSEAYKLVCLADACTENKSTP